MFIVLEIQKNLDGTGAIVSPIPVFDNRPEAESCWHSKLAFACISTVPIHTIILLDDDANTIRRETYLHKPEPQPEPELEAATVVEEHGEPE